jgi:aspartyl-tRNA(Asn)/glutamyl-tRNA(Gln) amidotransferase subunit C
MAKLTKAEVEHIANLARLHLAEKEKKQYGEQLSSILEYVEKMKEVDTKGVIPTSQVTGLTNVMREDNIEESSIHEELVECAPEKAGDQIVVPKVLENK